eukprot:12367728-Alexandrium_andersonii.AAC.1
MGPAWPCTPRPLRNMQHRPRRSELELHGPRNGLRSGAGAEGLPPRGPETSARNCPKVRGLGCGAVAQSRATPL